MEKLVLIDGHSILNRAFYGLPELTNSKGMHTNAVYGFLNILFKIMEEEKPDYLIVAFDVKAPTFRHEMFSEYKGNRKPMPAELHEQVPLLKDVLHAMDIHTVEAPGYEADDLLGSMAVKGEEQGLLVSLVSGDRDLLQIASENIKIRIPKTKRTGTEIEDYLSKDVIEKYGIKPAAIVDMKGLMGDASDNIPGVPGIGEKTALKILTAYETLENAYEHIDEIKPDKARKNMVEFKKQAELSKSLAKIKTDCELSEGFPKCGLIKKNAGGEAEIFTKKAYDLFSELEFKSFLVRFNFSGQKESQNETKNTERKNLNSADDIRDFFAGIKKEGAAVLAFELYGENRCLSGFSLGYEKKDGTVVTGVGTCKIDGFSDLLFSEMDGLGRTAPDGTSEEAETITSIITCNIKEQFHLLSGEAWERSEVVEEGILADSSDVLKPTGSSDVPSEAVTGSFDGTSEVVAGCFDLQPRRLICDLSIGAYLLNPLKDTYMRDDIARDFLGKAVKSRQECFGKAGWEEICNSGNASGEAAKEFADFAEENMEIYLKAFSKIMEGISRHNMEYLYKSVEMPLAFVLYSMEKEGIAVKQEQLKEYGSRLSEKIILLEKEIYDMAGEEFNINSPKQLGVILFEKLHLTVGKKTKTGYSTSAEVLNKLRGESPIIDKILEYRQLSKLKSTYADGLAEFIEDDGRIHGKFNQTVTATGRLSSAEPNLQNIPIRTEEGRKIRKVFVPRPGCIFIDADYSQIELRIMAHMSGDEKMIDAYHSAADIHQATASQVFHVPMDEVTKQQRRNAKAVNFGIIYGISSFGLGQDLDIEQKEAKKYIDNYFKTYPKIEEYMKHLVNTAKEKGYVASMFNRIRPIPELKSSNFMQRSFGERAAMNAPIQGTAADIMKIAMVRVFRRMKKEGLKSKMLVQVHDEILIEALPEEKERIELIMKEEMKGAADLSVSLEIEVSVGNDWYEAK